MLATFPKKYIRASYIISQNYVNLQQYTLQTEPERGVFQTLASF